MSPHATTSLAVLADTASRTYFELSRLQSMQQWWHWPLFAALSLVLLALVVALYRRDGEELPRTVRWLLITLRCAALAGLLIFFLGIEKRSEYRIVKNSRVVLAVDTSQSMGLVDLDPAENPGDQSRAERVADALQNSTLVEQLRHDHDVIVYGFDQSEKPRQLAALPKASADQPRGTEPQDSEPQRRAIIESRWMWCLAGALLATAVLGLLWHAVRPRHAVNDESWPLLVGVVSLLLALIVVGTNNVRHPDIGWLQLVRDQPLEADSAATAAPTAVENEASINWLDDLKPTGVATRLGDALSFIANEEGGGPIAGICLITDGNANAGLDWREAMQIAQAAEIPVYTVGVGSNQPPMNVRIVDLEVPARVYPGDAFNLTVFVQAFGLSGQTVRVELSAANTTGKTNNQGADNQQAPEIFIEERRVTLGADGQLRSLDFEVKPDQIGKLRYVVRVKAPPGDLDSGDNQQSSVVQVVDRKTKLLIVAGGPTREYQFLRTMCFRDPEITSHLYLQHAAGDVAQEADAILPSFPSFAEEMFDYDCVVAFDPDWMSLDQQQIELLERWVGEKAGGLILVAGPVYTPEWTALAESRSGDNLLRALYPVAFYQRTGSLLSRGSYVATKPWPIELTEDGQMARFLWLGDTASESREAWNRFKGVYGYQPVRGAKPAATVYGRFSNPDTEIDGELPVFWAGQFYGSGRVFYIASGELWRLNELDTNYFDQFYTKLIRYISEGRLLRDSSRGTLLVSKDRCVLGETIVVRASLSDPQFRPLDQPQVPAILVQPSGAQLPLILQKVQETGQAGTFSGQFNAVSEGDFRIDLPIPDSPDLELLTKTVRARLPDREVESPQRNDAVLSELATDTGGRYFVGLPAAVGSGTNDHGAADNRSAEERPGDVGDDAPGNETMPDRNQLQPLPAGLAASLSPQGQETYFPGAPDKDFQQRLMAWLIVLICGPLALEWLLRRLYRLA